MRNNPNINESQLESGIEQDAHFRRTNALRKRFHCRLVYLDVIYSFLHAQSVFLYYFTDLLLLTVNFLLRYSTAVLLNLVNFHRSRKK